MAKFPIPPGADEKTKKALAHFEEKFRCLTISESEVQFVINQIMKAQAPRDVERSRKEQQKRKEQADRIRRMAEYHRRH